MHCPDPALGYISPHTTFAKLKIIIKKRDMAPHPPPASSSLIPPNCLQCIMHGLILNCCLPQMAEDALQSTMVGEMFAIVHLNWLKMHLRVHEGLDTISWRGENVLF